MSDAQSTPHIFLIDDEPYILEALKRQLRGQPMHLTAFQDPLKALEEAIRERQLALVLSDNQMPGLKGLDLLSRIKEFAPQSRRILLTGHTELNDAIDAFNDGIIHRFINKPWDANDLIAVLHEELQKHADDLRNAGQSGPAAQDDPGSQTRLQQTVQELKQALTQVALYEDSHHLRRLRITPQMRRLTMLVVEDNPSVRNLLVTTMQKAGILAVTAVGSTGEALSYLRTAPPVDVILSEWNLPDRDGMALFQAVRGDQTSSAKAIFILMTPRENRAEVEYALKAGVDYYLIKPFHLDTLLDQIDRRLRRNRKPAQELQVARLRKLHMVVCNSDQDSRYRVQQFLLVNGIGNVTIADSASKAMRVLQERKVDVMVLDCNLLDVSWPDLREQLRELSGDFLPPSLVVTSVSPMPDEFERIYQAGITVFIPGEIRQRDLLDGIFKALEDDDRSDILQADSS